ncbi:MAG: HAD family hydrolase [Deltaproteobacteria bacterium]|nr:HAD family hydrolase [Deltaproteobacteria bacterium]
MTARFIDHYDVILLDMGNTFMFDGDRFGEKEDYHATYRQLGGQELRPEELRFHITNVFERMLGAGRDPARQDDFGDVRRFLAETISSNLSSKEVELIVEVFARHEIGTVPETHADALRQLSRSHPLGIVSNVWSPSSIFEAELERAGLLNLFAVRVWSSDTLSIKPSPRLFQKALRSFAAPPERVVYVGDNPLRDIIGAKSLGMATVWIENKTRPLTPEIPRPDLIISDLTQLPGVP